MTRMPGTARWARALLVVVGACGVVPAVRLTVSAVRFETGAMGAFVLGMLLAAALACASLAGSCLVIAARFADGGDKVRVGALAVGWLVAVGSAVAVLSGRGVWGAGVATGALLAVLTTGRDTREWFDRPRLTSSPGEESRNSPVSGRPTVGLGGSGVRGED
ncbi:hypothetical protein ACWERY_21775 [Streptomyces sp. NPDC004082]|uniref:hypothetical protein n=1 Tax=unclassified Streptomyces TaxID=2593676 RepID=UPI0033BBF903